MIGSTLSSRFRGFLPVVVDLETGGLNPEKDAILEIALVMLEINDQGLLCRGETHSAHILPFIGANIAPESLQITGIDPYHPFRLAISEEEALTEAFLRIRQTLQTTGCERAVLVGHNANFDLSFLQAACKRHKISDNPFHKFTTFDTATLSALAVGETVLAKAVRAAGMAFNKNEAHSAIYDAEITADLFCWIVNRWHEVGGWQSKGQNTDAKIE